MRHLRSMLMLNRLTIILLMAAGQMVSVSAGASDDQITLGPKNHNTTSYRGVARMVAS